MMQDRVFNLAGRLPKLSQPFAYGVANLRQSLGPEYNQSHHQDNYQLGKVAG
jgi:hypothetical protein